MRLPEGGTATLARTTWRYVTRCAERDEPSHTRSGALQQSATRQADDFNPPFQVHTHPLPCTVPCCGARRMALLSEWTFLAALRRPLGLNHAASRLSLEAHLGSEGRAASEGKLELGRQLSTGVIVTRLGREDGALPEANLGRGRMQKGDRRITEQRLDSVRGCR